MALSLMPCENRIKEAQNRHTNTEHRGFKIQPDYAFVNLQLKKISMLET